MTHDPNAHSHVSGVFCWDTGTHLYDNTPIVTVEPSEFGPGVILEIDDMAEIVSIRLRNWEEIDRLKTALDAAGVVKFGERS